MKNINEFNEERNIILEAYNLIFSSGLLPFGKYEKTLFDERIKNLENKNFLVAIAGRMKSGKSTLMNALIFEREILPSDDTVMTAKNTKIMNGDEDAIEIEYYNKEEWKEVLKTVKSNETEKEAFSNGLSYANENGFREADFIFSQNKIEKEIGLNNLHHYVAPSNEEKGGVKSLFVKSVKITTKNDWLKDITFVDTPGVGDPLKSREDVTKNFINQANAVIYLTFSSSAFTQSDIKFISDYLSFISQEKKMLVVSKIDEVNAEELNDYFRSLPVKEDPIIKSLFKDPDSIYGVSALAYLIEKLEEKNEQLKEDHEYYLNQVKESAYYESDKNGILALKNQIEKRIIKTGGADQLIQSEKDFINGFFEKALEDIDLEITTQKESLGDVDKDKDELDKKVRELDKKLKEFNDKLKLLREDLRIAGNDATREFKNLTKNKMAIFMIDLNNQMEAARNHFQIDTKIKAFLNHCTADWEKDFDKKVKKLRADLIKTVEDLLLDMISDSSMFKFKTIINRCFSENYSTVKIDFKDLSGTLDEIWDEMEKSFLFWDTDRDIADYISHLNTELPKIIDEKFDKNTQKLEANIEKVRDMAIDEVQRRVDGDLKLQKSKIKGFQEGLKTKEEERNEIESEISNLEKKKDEFKTCKSKINI